MTYLCISSEYFWAIPPYSLGFPCFFLFCYFGSLSYRPSLLWVLSQKCRNKPRLGRQVKIKAAQEVSFPGLKGQEDIWQMSKQRIGCWGCCVPAANLRWELIQKPQKGFLPGAFGNKDWDSRILPEWTVAGGSEGTWAKVTEVLGEPRIASLGPLHRDLFLGHLLCFSLIGFL